MSTIPPEQQQPPAGGPGRPAYGYNTMNMARMPIPGNAEFAVYLLVEIIFVLIWIIADSVDTRQWAIYTVVLTSFYILSRGIAKASRVLEQ